VPEERRLRKRVNLTIYLAATNAADNTPMGRIVDINSAGFLLLTESNFTLGTEYSINILLPEAINGLSLINCIANFCRISQSANPRFTEMGFDIIYASLETKKIIEIIQEKWKLNFPEV
jgi:hypothetical protein